MSQSTLSDLLAVSGVILLDGAQGTELERRGIDLSGSNLWSAQLLIDNPELLRQVHLDYLRAGSDVITTFSYQASLPGFAAAGLDAAAAAGLLNRAVDLAASARTQFLKERQEGDMGQKVEQLTAKVNVRHGPFIAFSCGSYGALLADGSEFRGDYAESLPQEDLMEFHRSRLEPVRHRAEIDLLAFETVPCLAEAEAIVRLLREEAYGKPAWISFSCKDAEHTCHGERFAEDCIPLLAAAADEGLVAAAGVNCTAPSYVEPLLAAARSRLTLEALRRRVWEQSTSSVQACGAPPQPLQPAAPQALQPPTELQPQLQTELQPTTQSALQPEGPRNSAPRHPNLLLLCYPNSGEQWAGRCWCHIPEDLSQPDRFAAAAVGWVRGPAHAALVGGCCRTGPEHIRALRQSFR